MSRYLDVVLNWLTDALLLLTGFLFGRGYTLRHPPSRKRRRQRGRKR